MSFLHRQFRASIISVSSTFLITRSAHTNSKTNVRRLTLRLAPRIGRIGLASGAATITLLGASLLASDVPDPTSTFITTPIQDANSPADRKPPPLASMLRSYVVFTMCCIPALVDWSPKILGTLMSIPVVKDITEAFVRATFFVQFVGGDTAQDTLPLLNQLRAENKGVLFAYSIEVDESGATHQRSASSSYSQSHPFHTSDAQSEPAHKKIVDEMIKSIDVAADFEGRYAHAHAHGTTNMLTLGRKTWVAIKLTALLPNAQSLINLSSHLIHSRPLLPSQAEIPFPGCARPTDLDVLYPSIPDITSYKPESSRKASSPLTTDDIVALTELQSDLVKICTRAKERGVKVVIDAEHSWYQPAIDAFTLSLQRQFNVIPPPKQVRSQRAAANDNVQPLVIGTYQAYLRRTPAHLAYSLQDAKANNYSLGVKLVRGAYHPHETAAHPSSHPNLNSSSNLELHSHLPTISPEPHPPVWLQKRETDECYNACARLLIREIKADVDCQHDHKTRGPPRIGVLFGTHNWESCGVILRELVDRGVAMRDTDEGADVIRIGADVTERLVFGQLYGMSDALTNDLVDRTRSTAPMVIKYVPYGALKDVMPYLSRRAIENKSILGDGGATDERKRAGAAIWKRIFG